MTAPLVRSAWARRFLVVWASQAVSLVGSSVAGFALVWWLTQATGSATVLAASALASTLPLVLLGPLAGALVDRHSRRMVMIVADAFIAVVSAWLAYLFWAGQAQPWHVFVIMAVRALGGAFHWPAMQASTSLMVPREQLSRIAGMNQTVQAVMGILAPPLGALLLSLTPIHSIMLMDVGTAAIAIGLLTTVAVPQPRRDDLAGPAAARPSVMQDLRAGVRYVLGWRALAMLLGLAALTNAVVNPAMTLTPILVLKHFHGGATHLAAINSAFGFGMVAGGLVLAAWGGFKRRMLTVSLAMAAGGILLLPVGLAPSGRFWLAIAGFAGFAFVLPIINGPIMAVIQATVAPEMQGRVTTLMISLAQVTTPLGLVVAGPLADAVGVRPLYIVAALVCLAVGLASLAVPDLQRFGERRPALAPVRGEAPVGLTTGGR